jgi:hypothetical protein
MLARALDAGVPPAGLEARGVALDGRSLGHGLPGRLIPLGELRVLLQHPATTRELQRAVFQDLVSNPPGGRPVPG